MQLILFIFLFPSSFVRFHVVNGIAPAATRFHTNRSCMPGDVFISLRFGGEGARAPFSFSFLARADEENDSSKARTAPTRKRYKFSKLYCYLNALNLIPLGMAFGRLNAVCSTRARTHIGHRMPGPYTTHRSLSIFALNMPGPGVTELGRFMAEDIQVYGLTACIIILVFVCVQHPK